MEKKSKLKLYIWTEFSPDWSGGLAFAIAETEKEARDLIIEEYGFSPADWGELEVKDISKCARYVSGTE